MPAQQLTWHLQASLPRERDLTTRYPALLKEAGLSAVAMVRSLI